MSPTLHGVMAYEDVSIAKLAKEKWDHLVHMLQPGFDFELRLWKFDALRIPELRDIAVNDAVEAQLVFVVTQGAGELPFEVKVWIEQWLAQMDSKRDAARLLALLSHPPPDKLGAPAFSQFAYLQQVARKGSMDFLASTAPIVTRPANRDLST
jgi:hypothetical protein